MDQADSSSSQLQPNAASSALQQLAGWQAQHRDHMRADVMQVMEESSDDESTLAEGSQVNMTANASSFGTLGFWRAASSFKEHYASGVKEPTASSASKG